MSRLELLLLAAVIASALGVVANQHQSRKIFVELQREKASAQRMDDEWGQLQLEQSTLAAPVRVEKQAVERLRMQLPKAAQVQHIRIANMEGSASRP